MAGRQQDWGAAEPIRQVGVRAYAAAKKYLDRVPSGRKPPARDTSWHDEKVREATRSVAERQARERAEAAKRKPTSRSAARKSSSRSVVARSSARRSSR